MFDIQFERWIEFDIRYLTFDLNVRLSLIFDIQNLNVRLSFIFDIRHSI